MSKSECDVLIVGSGAGALVAANAAGSRGAHVIVLEKSDQLGGGSALSGGLVYVPCNPWMDEAGIRDSVEDATKYLARISRGTVSDDALRGFLTQARAMVTWLAEETPLRFAIVPQLPDFHAEFDGGKLGGRHLNPVPYSTSALGEWADRTRRGQSPPVGYHEVERMGGPARPMQWDQSLIAERISQGVRAQGAGLVAALVEGCLTRGVEFRLEARAKRLLQRDDRVRGLVVEEAGGVTRLVAKRAVILATGGFEWNVEMNQRLLPAPLSGPLTVPSNEGDGHILGASIGAAFALMHESAWTPVVDLTPEADRKRGQWRHLTAEKGRPHSIFVNRSGARFVNESMNFYDMSRALGRLDPRAYEYRNLPAFMIFDAAYRAKYPLATSSPGESTPEWMYEAASLAALGKATGIEPFALEQTVARFNILAKRGKDRDFARGTTAYERYYGDPSISPNPSLAPIQSPPYFAVRAELGTFGNRGGMVTNADSQVVSASGTLIRGLYACGNTRAQLTLGHGYEAGGTLVQAMTAGYAAARAAL